MKLYVVNENYIKFLKKYDPRVPDNKEEKRPYIGVVFEINNLNYFAPLSSPKLKHLKMKENATFMKIKSGEFGIINFNNMIPINHNNIEPLLPSDKTRRNLIENQVRWFNSNKSSIKKKAKSLYILHSHKKLQKHHFKICNNFRLLEEKCKEWEQERLKGLAIKQLKKKYQKNKDKDLER